MTARERADKEVDKAYGGGDVAGEVEPDWTPKRRRRDRHGRPELVVNPVLFAASGARPRATSRAGDEGVYDRATTHPPAESMPAPRSATESPRSPIMGPGPLP